MEEQEKQVNEPESEATEEVVKEEPKAEDRPEENYKAELARKNAELSRLRAEAAARDEAKTVKYDPNDITTWNDNELKMLVKSQDANLARYRDQAEDLLLERKVRQMQARQHEESRKEAANNELADKYPEALDPTSDMAQKISKVMREYDLSRTPAGRLVAAKIVAAESKVSAAKGQDKEKSRVERVKANMVDGDRPKPTEAPSSKNKDLKEKFLKEKREDTGATADWIESRGLREKFNKTWGK